MEKYRMLLTGRDRTLIEDFLNLYASEYKIYSCMFQYDDIFNHIETLKPDIIIFALSGETQAELSRLAYLPKWFDDMGAQIFAVGNQQESGIFQAATQCLANSVILQPTTVDVVHRKIVEHMSQYEFMMEEMRQAEMQASEGITVEAGDSEKERRKHILVVDDDPVMLKTLKEMLHEEYDVGTAINGKVALRFLEAKHTDLVILDYEMPEMSGAETLEIIRNNPHTAHLPVVFLTGVTKKDKIAKVLSHKPQGYLLKPVQRLQLMDTIRKVLNTI